MIICMIMLIVTIVALIYIIINKNDKYIKLSKKNTKLTNDNQFLEREIKRCNLQLGLYEEDKKEAKDIILGTKKIKRNNIYEGKRAILGDYSKDSSDYSRKVLESFGLIVDVVRTGCDIIDRVSHNFQYDIIFTNSLYKNNEKGKDVLEKLKEREGFKTPVVIHTINQNKRDYYINVCKFDEYLEKPLKRKDVEKILSKFF